MEKPQSYGRYTGQYISGPGTTYDIPIGSHPQLGETLSLIFNKYPEIKNEMKDLLKIEGPGAHGPVANEGRGLFGTILSNIYHGWYGDKRANAELDKIVDKSLTGLSDLVYLTGYHTVNLGGGQVFGEHVFGQADEEANYNIRNYPAVPDTVIYPSPVTQSYQVWNPEKQKAERVEETLHPDDSIKTLIHESLLHGMDIWHPTVEGQARHSQDEYEKITENIFNILSDEDKEQILYFMLPDSRLETPYPTFQYPDLEDYYNGQY